MKHLKSLKLISTTPSKINYMLVPNLIESNKILSTTTTTNALFHPVMMNIKHGVKKSYT